MAEFQYVKQGGGLGTVQAETAEAAISQLPTDALQNTGVMLKTPTTKAVQEQSAEQMTEPTVISDTGVREDIPKLNEKVNTFTETGQFYDNQGNLRNADGSLVEEQDNELTQLEESIEDDDREINNILTNMQKTLDSNTARQVTAIKQQYSARRQQLAEINRRNERATDTALLLGGSSRYTTSGEGISAGQATAGIMELAELDALEQAAIADVKAAQAEGNFRLMSSIMENLEEQRKKKIDKATEISEALAEQNNKLRERMKQQTKEFAIADLYKQGITDPTDLMEALTEAGGDYTLSEIQDTLDIISPSSGLEGASTDYKTFKIMQEEGEVPSSWNFFDYKTAVKNASGGGDSIDVDITSEDERTLIGGGFTPQEIEDIKKSVNDFGVDAVLDTLEDERQREAIRDVYGVQKKITREDIEQTTTLKMAQDGLRATYTDDELSEIAREQGFAAFFTGKEGEVEDFLNSDKAKEIYVNLLEEQYRNAGMLE